MSVLLVSSPPIFGTPHTPEEPYSYDLDISIPAMPPGTYINSIWDLVPSIKIATNHTTGVTFFVAAHEYSSGHTDYYSLDFSGNTNGQPHSRDLGYSEFVYGKSIDGKFEDGNIVFDSVYLVAYRVVSAPEPSLAVGSIVALCGLSLRRNRQIRRQYQERWA